MTEPIHGNQTVKQDDASLETTKTKQQDPSKGLNTAGFSKLAGAFGQIVIGPPGSGKTTYCAAMAEYLSRIGRTVCVVNLDPANERLPYQCSIDISELIRLEEVMAGLGLGPNGGLVYSMAYLYANRDWLAAELIAQRRKYPRTYFIFDCPGQVELYTHHPPTRELINWLTKTYISETTVQSTNPMPTSSCISQKSLTDGQLNSPTDKSNTLVSSVDDFEYLSLTAQTSDKISKFLHPNSGLGLRLTSVHLVDSHYCCDPGKFISCLMVSLSSMLQLGLPHVNILSKADLVEQYGPLPFNLDYFSEVLDLSYLVDRIQDEKFYKRYKKLNEALIGLIENKSLVQFLLLDVQESDHLDRVMRNVDRANGYVFTSADERAAGVGLQAAMGCAVGAELRPQWASAAQEKYCDQDNNSTQDDIPNIDLLA